MWKIGWKKRRHWFVKIIEFHNTQLCIWWAACFGTLIFAFVISTVCGDHFSLFFTSVRSQTPNLERTMSSHTDNFPKILPRRCLQSSTAAVQPVPGKVFAFAFARASHEYDYGPFRTRETQTNSKATKCKLQWIQKLTKVNIPLFKRDPTCVTSSKLKPWWVLKFGLNKFVQIVVPSLVWASTSSTRWERKVVEPVAAGIPFCWISGHPSGLFTRCHKYWNCRLKSETLQGLIWCNDVADCNLSFMRFIVSPQSSSLTTTHPTIDQSIQRCTTFSNDDNPKRIVGEIIALRYFSRNFKETCLLIKVSLCLWNFSQTTRKRWANSAWILVGKFPVKIQPKHLCLQASWSTSAKSFPISTCKGVSKTVVVKNSYFWRGSLQTHVSQFHHQQFNHLD